jgi:hypothetical protein
MTLRIMLAMDVDGNSDAQYWSPGQDALSWTHQDALK